ncbi:hypothetical protein VTK73DRAFT_4391 [Phialemonium thermophilum]|uniref:Protein SQS1 n=1 Tax=Phialemonium thermophilum TaxID=223376 RepID=A0ABR3Y071_9PEZI
MTRKKGNRSSAGPRAARLRAMASQSKIKSLSSTTLKNVNSSAYDFTLRDEARSTAHHQSTWTRGAKLREQPVTFVTAGFIEPLRELEHGADEIPVKGSSQIGLKGLEGANPSLQQVSGRMTPVEDHGRSCQHLNTTERSASVNDGEDRDQPFFIDTEGDSSLVDRSLPIAVMPNHESSDNESDVSEIILFKGRSTRRHNADLNRNGFVSDVTTIKSVTKKASSDQVFVENFRTPPVVQDPRSAVGHLPPHADRGEEDDIVADYIANMANDSEDDVPYDPIFVLRDIGGDESVGFHNQITQDESETGSDAQEIDHEKYISDDLSSVTGEALSESEIDDETLARLLSKQEELGLGGEELLLSDMHSGVTQRPSKRDKTRHKKHALKPPTSQSFSASSVADAFDDLDLMDWDRPSLRNAAKGKRRLPIFNVTDSELESAMQTAWEKDRERKKQRKLEREELRSKGLLGKHANPSDLRNKYQAGMTLDDIKGELRAFLLGKEPSLQLPPMDKSARKILHELANKFKVKSQSTGSGDQRRPTLYRTKYTLSFTEHYFEMATSRIGRRYFPRLDSKGRGSGRRGPGREGNSSALTYRDGEVVGASAPELGQDNKGRAILEKMGWSSGMGLGAMDNKGILQPVAQVVKRTKAGLGQA